MEYSSREVCPPSLLLQCLLRAHSIFLLHHAPSLAQLYARLTRPKFCGALGRFWNSFLLDWDVLLSGNPAVDIYNGLKLAAGGELGIGVGEEEWGSGEREVLEGFIGRTEGLVDLIVSRFGDSPPGPEDASNASTRVSSTVDLDNKRKWLGASGTPRPSDGVIFSGIGAVARPSIRDISAWVEWIFKYGRKAYGVMDNPNSARRWKRKVTPAKTSQNIALSTAPRSDNPKSGSHGPSRNLPPSIPPPIVTLPSNSSAAAATFERVDMKGERVEVVKDTISYEEEPPATETLMKYLTLGVYGSSWGIPSKRSQVHRQASEHHKSQSEVEDLKRAGESPMQQLEPRAVDDQKTKIEPTNADVANGFFLIGLQGDLDNEDEDIADDERNSNDTEVDREERREWNSRMTVRTIHVKRGKGKSNDEVGSPER